jgi:hypothetical protein
MGVHEPAVATPAPVVSAEPEHAAASIAAMSPAAVLAMQQTAGNQSVTRWLTRKELPAGTAVTSPADWTTADREGATQAWKDACLANLNAVDSSQYVRVVERRDFYKWFYEYTTARGYGTRWALAARLVADGAHQIADMDEHHDWANDTLGMANVELQGAMREGNQIIFDNVLPKLKKLVDGGPLKGRAALEWDMKILSEEQALVQPMYARMSKESLDELNYIARKKRFAGWGADMTGDDVVAPSPGNKGGVVPAFDGGSLTNVDDRWNYGMKLGDTFTPGGTGFVKGTDTRPAPGAGYTDGSELAAVDNRASLHELDAWLNPNRLSRVGAGSDVKAIIGKLTPGEKARVLADHSPDGWAYSKQFAQFGFIDDATVQAALPAGDPGVGAFMGRYRAERARVQAATTPAPDMAPF